MEMLNGAGVTGRRLSGIPASFDFKLAGVVLYCLSIFSQQFPYLVEINGEFSGISPL